MNATHESHFAHAIIESTERDLPFSAPDKKGGPADIALFGASRGREESIQMSAENRRVGPWNGRPQTMPTTVRLKTQLIERMIGMSAFELTTSALPPTADIR